jgi:MFS family permease
LLYANNFVLASALGVIFVFLEDVQVDNGLADWEIGVVAAAGFAAALAAQLLLAPMADQGRSRPLALIALATGVIGPIGFAYGSTMSVLALSRGLTGIALGLFSLLARKALLGLDATGGGAKLGLLLSTGVGGFICGPLIGASLEPLGFEAPFLAVSAAVALLGLPATNELLNAPIAATPVDYGDLGRLLARPRVQAALLVQLVVFGFIGVFDAVVDRFLTDLGASTAQVAITILCVGAPLLVLPRIAGVTAERRGAGHVMFPALVVLIPAMFGYGVAGSVMAAAAFGILHGTGESFVSVGAQVLVLEVTGAERAAVGAALLDTAGFTSAAVTAAAAPMVYGRYGGTALFVSTGLAAVVIALIALQRVAAAPELAATTD